MAVTDLTGTRWQFNQKLANTGSDLTGKINYTLDGETRYTYDKLYLAVGSYYTLYVNKSTGSPTFSNMEIYRVSKGSSTGSWTTNKYAQYSPSPPIITILGGEDATNQALITWLEENAVLLEMPTTPTTITCNGVDTELNEGQTATLKCANKKAVSDIVVSFGSAGTITYNGTQTAVESGKTATLQCNGKKMKTDVVIAL